jgi:hypothetical protein
VKSTGVLTILGDISIDEKTLRIHPNDGFDLGLMTTEYPVRLHFGDETDASRVPAGRFLDGTIQLRNEVRPGNLELGLKAAARLGNCRRAVLHYRSEGKVGALLVVPADD